MFRTYAKDKVVYPLGLVFIVSKLKWNINHSRTADQLASMTSHFPNSRYNRSKRGVGKDTADGCGWDPTLSRCLNTSCWFPLGSPASLWTPVKGAVDEQGPFWQTLYPLPSPLHNISLVIASSCERSVRKCPPTFRHVVRRSVVSHVNYLVAGGGLILFRRRSHTLPPESFCHQAGSRADVFL